MDHCFQKAGFDKKRLFYTQGDYGLFQCSVPCRQETFDNEEIVRMMVDEQKDGIIRLQQRDFPVIDYHVHLKGDLTKEMAHAMSMNYGINYGVAPNAGEGGVGRMLADDAEVYAYHDEISGEPFLFGVQGEGRRWTATFSQEALGIFEYLFTDAMTIVDHKGRLSRIYRGLHGPLG